MGFLDFVTSPVAADDPCGPDLEGTNDFDVALADIEGKWPSSYAAYLNPEQFTPFKPGFNLAAELAPLLALLKQSRDIRLLVPVAKFAVMGGDLEKFSDALTAIAQLLSEQWDAVHPRGTGGSYAIRESELARLTETVTVLLPLQDAPFCVLPRLGKISYRTQMLATKAVSPRPKETALDETALRDALVKRDPATRELLPKHEEFESIVNSHKQLTAAAAALTGIAGQFAARLGPQQVPDFEKLTTLLAACGTFLEGLIRERDPTLAPPPEGADSDAAPDETQSGEAATGEAASAAAPPAAAVGISTGAEAAAALKAVETYFRVNEPSNPATLLVRQARELFGKSFIEAMVILNPQLAEKAAIKIGGDVPLTITSAQMKTLSQGGAAPAAGDAPEPPVANRQDALAQMQAIERFYQRTEPSSPIPMLLTRARSYAGRDFAALLKELGP